MEVNQVYKCFKYYDKRGRRLSIFAVDSAATKRLHIHVITCSLQDNFCKQKGEDLFNKFIGENGLSTDVHPQYYSIPYTSKPRKTFTEFCANNFYHKVTEKKVVKLDDYVDVGRKVERNIVEMLKSLRDKLEKENDLIL